MKLLLVLAACAALALATPLQKNAEDKTQIKNEDQRSVLLNLLMKQILERIRKVIVNGSDVAELPPLDPYIVEYAKLNIPAGLINFEIEIHNGVVAGAQEFVLNSGKFNVRELYIDMDITVPTLLLKADHYKLLGDFYTAIPFYGEGAINLVVNDVRYYARMYLKQSEDEKSVVIDRIESSGFQIGSTKSDFGGIIGGGDFDAITNAIIEDIMPDYLNRFNKSICAATTDTLIAIVNPIMNRLNTWRYINFLQ